MLQHMADLGCLEQYKTAGSQSHGNGESPTVSLNNISTAWGDGRRVPPFSGRSPFRESLWHGCHVKAAATARQKA